MQKEDNILDQYLKHKVDEADFDFKEEYWLKASQMLDDEDKKRKRPFFWRWVVVLGVLITAGIGTLIFSNKNNQNNNKSEITQNTATTPSTSQPAKSYVADNPQPAVNTPQPGSENKTVEVINKKQNAGNEVNASNNNKTANTNPALHTPAADKVNENVQTAVNQNALQNQGSKPAKRSKWQALKDKFGKSKADNPKKSPTAIGTQLPAKTNPANNINNQVMVDGRKMQPIDTQVFVQKQPRDESLYNPRYNASLRNYETERLDSITVFTFKKLPEINTEAAIPELKKDTSAKKNSTLHFFIAGGANFNKGFSGNTNTTVAWGIAPYLSAGIEKEVNSKISLASQIGFTYFNALNVQKKVVNYKYSFGFDSTQLSVEYRRMYQLLLPVSIAYHLNKLHTVWASIGASYVLNTSSKVTQSNSAMLSSISQNQTGYTDGINPLDLFAQLGYQYMLSNKFGMQAFLQQGFLNATKKDYFNITTSNTQTRISIGLKYYFKRNGH